ncbi:MAG: hypothetical protein KC414_13550, partial [Romboutsia sp.]|nr:hypothetical protein [Romboutsia sp.]
SLYTNRYAACNNPGFNDKDIIKKDIESLNAKYLVQDKYNFNYASQIYLDSVLPKKDTTFYNNSFVIYRIN